MASSEANSLAREDQTEEQEMNQRGNRLVLPEDGYEWKKYGQKFIRGIGKVRSYFKCQKANCMARKKAEWCTSEPANIRIVYEGVHSHGSNTEAAPPQGSNDSNQYNLLTQVLRDQSNPTSLRPNSGS